MPPHKSPPKPKKEISRYAASFPDLNKANIPPFKAKIIPPYTADPISRYGRSPYRTTLDEFVKRFSDSPRRKYLLRRFLAHRAAIRSHAVMEGVQWIGGGFIDDDHAPSDVDVVTLFMRPCEIKTADDMARLMAQNPEVFEAPVAKNKFSCDAYFIDLSVSNAYNLIENTNYWFSLFSHGKPKPGKRAGLWKGMIEIPLASHNGDAHALSMVEEMR